MSRDPSTGDRSPAHGTPAPETAAPRWLKPAVVVAGLVVLASSIATLVGWSADIARLTSPVPESSPTQPITAVVLASLAFAVLLQVGRPGTVRRAVGVAVGSVVLLITSWSVVGYAASVEVPLDTLLFEGQLDATRMWPGRPSIQTLVVMATLAGSLIGVCLPNRRVVRRLAVGCQMAALAVLTVVLVSFIAGAGEITLFNRTLGMSWPTAAISLVLLLATIGTRPERPPLAWLSGGTLDGFTVSRVLPVIVLVPFVVRGVQIVGEWAGLDSVNATFIAELVALMLVGVALVGTARAKQRAEGELAARQALYGAVVNALSEGLVIRDPDGRLVMANPAAFELTPDIIDESPMDESVHSSLALFDETGHRLAREDMPTNVTLRTGQAVRARLVQLGNREGGPWVLVNSVPLGTDGGAVTTMTDVTDRSRAERALAEAEERFRTAFEHAPISMAMVAPNGQFQRVNPAFTQLLGHDRAYLEAHTSEQLTHPDDMEENVALSRRLLDGEIASYTVDKRYRHADGSWVWTTMSVSLVRHVDGTPDHFVAQVLDLRDRKRLEDELSHLAMHDSLTELPNRRLVIDRLDQALVRSVRLDERVGVIYVDLDGFKEINDTFGHDTGDRVLVEVSIRLRDVLRRSDTAGRLGGDEFIVISEGLADDLALDEVVHRVEQALQGEIEIAGRTIPVSASVGACLASPSDDAATLLRVADGAMYAVKRARRASTSHLRVVRDEPDAETQT